MKMRLFSFVSAHRVRQVEHGIEGASTTGAAPFELRAGVRYAIAAVLSRRLGIMYRDQSAIGLCLQGVL
jgi:hypothetical protein